MTPFRFGRPDRQMFGIYQGPIGEVDHGEALLMCNPFGQEAIRSHRLFKLIADRLARNGLHVMRFDYFGTGDSDGDDVDVSFDGFVDDTQTAHTELLRRANVGQVSWLGLRLGASIAAISSSATPITLKRLVLLEPIFSGREYIEELDEAHNTALKRSYGVRWMIDHVLRTRLSSEIGREALGFSLPVTMRERLLRLTPATFANANAETCHLLRTAGSGSADNLHHVEKLLASRGLMSSVSTIPDSIVWTANEMLNASVVPASVLGAVEQVFGGQR
jgi:uncharacterized protein